MLERRSGENNKASDALFSLLILASSFLLSFFLAHFIMTFSSSLYKHGVGGNGRKIRFG